MNKLYAVVSGVTDISEVRLTEDYTSPTARCEVVCQSSSLGVNDSIVVDAGYVSDHGTIFTGYVKAIRRNLPAYTYTLECQDVLVRATDNFLASDDPQNPLQYSNTSAEDIVGDLLSRSQVSNYTGSASSFTFGVTDPVKFNLATAWDFIAQICDLLAFDCFADASGNVFFKSRPPRPAPAEASSFTFSVANQNVVMSEYDESTDNLRNRVVVYGDQTANVFATAQATSPYLPSGFYQTTVIGSQFIQTQTQAQDTANFNLSLLNHLTETARLQVLGDYRHHTRKVATLDESFTGLSGDWLIHSLQASWGRSGYLSEVVLSR